MFYAYFFNIFLILPLQYPLLYVIINFISAVFEKEVTRMRENLHPNYKKTTISCACGNVIETASTKENIKVEICSKCHPFFTGKQKLVDTGGRVDRFKRRFSNKKD